MARRDWLIIRRELLGAENGDSAEVSEGAGDARWMCVEIGWLAGLSNGAVGITWQGREALDLLRDEDRLRAALDEFGTGSVPWSLLEMELQRLFWNRALHEGDDDGA